MVLALSLVVSGRSLPSSGAPARRVSLVPVAALTGQIIFQAKMPTTLGTKRMEVVIMEEDGSDVRRLSPERGVDFRGMWSPDGTQIVYSSTFFGDRGIVLMNADGTGQTALTSGPADDDPAWSYDGQSLVFVSPDAGGVDDIWVMNADGSNRRNLTNTPAYFEHNPSWSRDGQFIFFSAVRVLKKLDIWIMNADGSSQRRWSQTDRDADHIAAWHPLLPKVVYHSHEANEGELKGGRIWLATVDPATGDVVSKQPLTTVVNPNSNEFGDESPDWSPDGTRVVFTGPRLTDSREIYTMNADGTNITRLLVRTGQEYHPRWSPRPERLRNAGMEKDLDKNGLPDDWTSLNFEPGDGRITTDAVSGGASLLIQGNAALDKRLQQLLTLSGSAGQTLTLAAWSKDPGFTPNGTYKLTLTLFHPDATTTEFTLTPTNHQEWRYVKATFTAPKDFDQALVEIHYGFQTGTAGFDNVALYK